MTKTAPPKGDKPTETTPPPAPEIELERPRSGGSYVRQTDGSLKQQDVSSEPKED